VYALAVLHDGRLASASEDATIRIWELNSESSSVFKGHEAGVRALTTLPDGRLASGSADSTIRLWNAESNSQILVFEGHRNWVNTLVILPDGRLASGSDDNTIRFWDPAIPGGSPKVAFVSDSPIYSMVVHPSRQFLVAGDASGRLHWLALPPTPR